MNLDVITELSQDETYAAYIKSGRLKLSKPVITNALTLADVLEGGELKTITSVQFLIVDGVNLPLEFFADIPTYLAVSIYLLTEVFGAMQITKGMLPNWTLHRKAMISA